MAGKKGIIPEHIKQRQKKFFHPEEQHQVICIFKRVEDPREPSLSFRHSLTSILFMALIAVICGSSDWEQVIVACEGMKDWLAKYVDMSAGVPCERTFKNVFNALKPEALEKALQELSSLLREKIPKEIISFDGQTSCGTADKQKDLRGIHLLNVWSADNKICLAQLKIDDKSNEIPAMSELMDQLDLSGTIITADAMNTQKATVEKIIEKEADYVLPVKRNHETLFNDIELMFNDLDEQQKKAQAQREHAIKKAKEHRDHERLKELLNQEAPTSGASVWTSDPEKAHGRIETRSCTALSIGELPSKEGWKGLQTIARISRERTVGGITSHETIYYISSLAPDAAFIAEVIRDHWGIENKLHWRLDVHFRQDASRYRDRQGASNLGIIRKIGLNMLLKEKTLKKGVATKQQAAACNPEYRSKVLKNLF
jgi:predicted transposase YbfD/YdcC